MVVGERSSAPGSLLRGTVFSPETAPNRRRSSTSSTHVNNNFTEHDAAAVDALGVVRVGREVENIGERVPMSKKRISWRFVFVGSEQVHTVTLEHSRITAKKRLRLDGRKLFNSEQYCAGDWKYQFTVDGHATVFCVAIKDVKSTVVMDHRSLDSIYELFVEGFPFQSLPERVLRPDLTRLRQNAPVVWSSELYARRVELVEVELEGDMGKLVAWTFAFGRQNGIHRLELRDLSHGEFVVLLDSEQVMKQPHEEIETEQWQYECTIGNNGQHRVVVLVTLEDEGKTYELFIDGCRWSDIGETDYVLQPGWYPVHSRSKSSTYFRHEQSQATQWEKPIMPRHGLSIAAPKSLAEEQQQQQAQRETLAQRNSSIPKGLPPLPLDRLSIRDTTSNQTAQANDSNLLDFSEIAVHVSPVAKDEPSYLAFDPFAPTAQESLKSGSLPSSANGNRCSIASNQNPALDLLA